MKSRWSPKMFGFKYFLKIIKYSFVIRLIILSSAISQGKVTLGIIYTSKSRQSANFMKDQLLPAYKNLGTLFSYSLFPFLKAKTAAAGLSQELLGDEDCAGDILHACASLLEPDQGRLLQFVVCTMQGAVSICEAGNQCATRLDMNYGPIEQCARGEVGKALMLKTERNVNNLVPELEDLPAVVVNWKFNASEQKMALESLQTLICSYINNPEACLTMELEKIFHEVKDDIPSQTDGDVNDQFPPELLEKLVNLLSNLKELSVNSTEYGNDTPTEKAAEPRTSEKKQNVFKNRDDLQRNNSYRTVWEYVPPYYRRKDTRRPEQERLHSNEEVTEQDSEGQSREARSENEETRNGKGAVGNRENDSSGESEEDEEKQWNGWPAKSEDAANATDILQ